MIKRRKFDADDEQNVALDKKHKEEMKVLDEHTSKRKFALFRNKRIREKFVKQNLHEQNGLDYEDVDTLIDINNILLGVDVFTTSYYLIANYVNDRSFTPDEVYSAISAIEKIETDFDKFSDELNEMKDINTKITWLLDTSFGADGLQK